MAAAKASAEACAAGSCLWQLLLPRLIKQHQQHRKELHHLLLAFQRSCSVSLLTLCRQLEQLMQKAARAASTVAAAQ
jgi:hypothetical protein